MNEIFALSCESSHLSPPQRRLRIGLDGTTLQRERSGIGFYTEHLTAGLLAVNRAHDYRVFSNSKVHSDNLPDGLIHGSGRFPVRGVWMQAILPFLLRREKVDVCHYTNYLAPLWSGCPSVVTIHDMTLTLLPECSPWKKRLLLRPLIPLAARRADAIITVSESARRDILRLLRVPEHKVHVIPEGVSRVFQPVNDPLALGRIRERYGLKAPYFVAVGAIEPRKNLVRAARALAGVRRMLNQDVRLLLAGAKGWRSDSILREIREVAGEAVIWPGYVPTEDLPGLYSGAVGLVYPSLYEGFGLPVVEAMASGAPVITSDNSSMREVAGDAALLVNPEDEEDIRSAMAKLVESEALRRSLRARGLSRASRFSWEEAARKTVAVYEAVCRTRAHSRETPRSHIAQNGKMLQVGKGLNGIPPAPAIPAPRRTTETAAIRTAVYASLFDYPLTLEEMHRGLFGASAALPSLQEALDRCGRISVVRRDGRVFLPLRGEEGTVDLRLSREQRHAAYLDRMRPTVERLCRLPFVRMVALSGGSAVAYGDDLDLFVIAAPGKVWSVTLASVLLARATGARRDLCVNYLVDEAALTIPARDLFTAHQILTLKPVYGLPVYHRFIAANGWVLRHFPNFIPYSDETPFEAKEGRGKQALERLLGPLSRASEYGVRGLYGRYLRRKAAALDVKSGVDLTSRRLQLNVVDHKEGVTRRFEEKLSQLGTVA